MHELLAVGIEFPDLGMAKIELDHPVLGVDSLNTRLNEWCSSKRDIPLLLSNISRRSR